MITTFKTATSGINAQPVTEKLIVRSTDAADTATLTASGTVSASPDTDAITLLGKREVEGTKAFSAPLVAARLSTTCDGTVTIRGQGTKAQGVIRLDTNPNNDDTLVIGLTGFTRTYIYKTTLTGAANEVLRDATDAEVTAGNLNRAINAAATAGTNYGTGTVAHAHLSSTVSGSILTFTDKIACLRQLVWSFSQTGTAHALGTMTGGVDGTLLVTLAIGEVNKIAAIALDDESLALGRLPALVDWYSDWITLAGKRATIYLDGGTVSSGSITAAYQTTTDALKANVRTEAIGNVNANSQIKPLTESSEWVRLHLTSTSPAAISVNAKIVFG